MSRKPPVALPDTEDPYVLLDVRPGASADQIRRAYLRRVKVYKPDRHPAEFRRVRAAYDRLREQERWFDAWRQANEVVRQAAEAEAAREGRDDGEDDGGEDDGDEGDALSGDEEHGGRGRTADAEDGDAGDDEDRGDDEGDHDAPHDDREDEDEDADDEDLAALMAALEDELRLGREGGRGRLDEDDDDAAEDDADEDASPIDLDRGPPRRDPAEDARRRERAAELTERLAALEQQVHAALQAGTSTKAATLLLAPEIDALAARPELATLLLEVCCAVVWDEPAQFQALVDRYGDLVSAHDTEYRDGALLHRRTLTHELPGWRQAVAAWPELHQFLVLGASLRAPAEAELGLRLGKRAATDVQGFLHVLAVAAVHAPGIVALYVGMAERWSRHYGRLLLPGPPRDRSTGGITGGPTRRPTLAQAADAVALAAQHHRFVRWEQLRPLLVSTIVVVVLMLARSPMVELVVIGMVVVLWGWRAWAADPETRIYLRVVRPAAAAWLWAARTSPDELAAALRARLPAAGTWGAVLHPGDLSEYPDQLADDLALLAFSVTAPMIPLLRSPETRSGSGSG